MKKYILILTIVLLPVIFSSCLESYLDKSPDAGLTTDDVFRKLDNFKSYFLSVYNGKGSDGNDYNIKMGYPFFFCQWGNKTSWEDYTDCADNARLGNPQAIKTGLFSPYVNLFTYDRTGRPILGAMFQVIYVCNMTLQNIHLLHSDQVTIDDYTAQAHFVRAFAHFELFRFWGAMPYQTKVMGPTDQWDMPRLSKHETLMRIAADMDTAATYFAKAGFMRRDNPVAGAPGNLTNSEQARPNGVAAKAYKARALLYAASPLNNELGVKDWENAAKASWEAIDVATQYGYALQPGAKYNDNYTNVQYTNEQIWAWDAGKKSYNDGTLMSTLNGMFANSTGASSPECPTQNFVDKFETKYGEPLNTQAERDAATAAGHYNEQNPYANRDPRFDIDIIYNQAPNIIGWTNSKAQMYYTTVNGAAVYAELIDHLYAGYTRTGYYQRKIWGGQSVKNNFAAQYTDPLMRLGELYLDYAEAANEAYGPSGSAPGASMTALQAVNLVRNRISQPNVLAQFTGSTDALRPRIKNERIIELCFEGHYFHDLRRWEDAPAVYSAILMGIDIEKVAVSSTYPAGFKHTRIPLTADRQISWKDAMYYFPFPTTDVYKMKNFVPNVAW